MGRILLDKLLREIASRRLTPTNEEDDRKFRTERAAEYRQLLQKTATLIDLSKLRRTLCDAMRFRQEGDNTASYGPIVPKVHSAGLPILRDHYRPSIYSFMHAACLEECRNKENAGACSDTLAVASSDVRGKSTSLHMPIPKGTLTYKR